MTKNPNLIPILLIFLLLKNSSSGSYSPPAFSPLQLESLLDNARSMLHTLEKLSTLSEASSSVQMPDMKKLMEIVEKLPL